MLERRSERPNACVWPFLFSAGDRQDRFHRAHIGPMSHSGLISHIPSLRDSPTHTLEAAPPNGRATDALAR